MQISAYSYTSPGGREYNEDYHANVYDGETGLFVVADGLGGHTDGSVASKCVTDVLTGRWEAQAKEKGFDLEQWFSGTIQDANDALVALCSERGKTMKTTVALLGIAENSYGFAHVGDTRCYHIHDGVIAAVTEDHSVAYKKYKSGEITKRSIATDEDQSALLRTLGGESRNMPDISVLPGKPQAGDAFLLCTDGAWEYFDDLELLADFAKSRDPRDLVHLLLLRMIERVDGKNDNLTLTAVFVD